MAELVNLTPHALAVHLLDGSVMTVEPSGTVARCRQQDEQVGVLAGAPVFRTVFGEVVDLPEEQKGTTYVVSRLVASACPDRHDLVVPGPLVRDDQGVVIGCRGFSVVW